MKRIAVALLVLLASAVARSQPISGPDPGYVPVPDVFRLPPNANFGAVSGVAINSKGNIFVLTRGPQPLMEFDASGPFHRAQSEAGDLRRGYLELAGAEIREEMSDPKINGSERG